MSWSLNVGANPGEDAAKEAAKAVIASGAVGDASKGFNIGLSGHGNEDHEPRAGWSNDVITINVSQATAAAEAE
jgi:hypothetical protein